MTNINAKLKIAFLQLLSRGNLQEQWKAGEIACKEAHAKGADIALFPEMWSDGYYLPQDKNTLKKFAISKNCDFIRSFASLAMKLRMAIGITLLEDHEPSPLNSIIIFDRNGKEVLHYSKVHTCAFDMEKVLCSGEDFYVTDLDTAKGMVKIGSMICFDREFPESARILMLKGAEVVLVPNACPMEINRLSALRTRAYENMIAIATCNYPKGQLNCNGHSTLFDGIPWSPDEPEERDMCVFEAPEEEGIYIAELDLGKLRKHRKEDVMGNKYRHPKVYTLLTHNK